MSPQTLSRLELGDTQRPDPDDVLELLDLYDADRATRERVTLLARLASTRAIPRPKGRAGMGDRQRAFADLEAVADDIHEFQPAIVPPLLQTADYARVRVRSVPADPDLDVEAEVAGRALRQRVITGAESSTRYDVLLAEAALRPAALPAPLYADQLRHLVESARWDNVTIRVIRADARIGACYVPPSGFALYRSPALTTVVVETLTTDLHLHEPHDVAVYEQTFRWLRDAALSPEHSIELLTAHLHQP